MTGTAMGVQRLWTAPRALPPGDQREFSAMLRYCLADATAHGLTLTHDTPRIEYSAADPDQADRIGRLLDEAFRRFGGSVRPCDRTKLDRWQLPAEPLGAPREEGRIGPGLFVGDPENARLIRALDGIFFRLATRLGAAEYTVPAMVSWSTLEKAGYLRNFPQHITATAVVRPDLDALDRFAASAGLPERVPELQIAPIALAPAPCLGLFERFSGVALAEPLTMTAIGKCSRYEGDSDTSPTRLWSYSVREILFIGDRPAARQFHEAALAELIALASELALPCRVAPAGDPFFTSQRPQLVDYQAAMDVKYELAGRMARTDAAVAVTSLNYHNQHFGKGFAIDFDGQPAFSVCMGFGLERWAEWLAGYLPEDPSGWPAMLRDPN